MRNAALFLLFAAVTALIAIVAVNRSRQADLPRAVAARLPQQGARVVYGQSRPAHLIFPDGERKTIHSVLNIARPMKFGQFVWNEAGARAGPVWVRIDLAAQTLSVFRAGDEIGTSVIMYGADEKPTPTGRLTVLAKFKDHRSSLYEAEMPFTMRLTNDGVAIHGSDVRRDAATHGCIGVPAAFAERLFEQIKVGDAVLILPADPARSLPAKTARRNDTLASA